MAKAQWSLAAPSQSVGADGTARLSVQLKDGATVQGTLSFEMTADRMLTVTWDQKPGVQGLAGFAAWSKEP